MTIYIPTSKVVDERVVCFFEEKASQPAGRSYLSSSKFKLFGELCLGDVLTEIKKNTSLGLNYYRQIVYYTPYAFMKYVPTSELLTSPGLSLLTVVDWGDSQLIESYQKWFADIARDTIGLELHDSIIEALCSNYPSLSNEWQRAGELVKRGPNLTRSEQLELTCLEDLLDSNQYNTLKRQITPSLIARKKQQILATYKLTNLDLTFGSAFNLVQEDLSSHLEIYQELIDLHDGFELKKP